MGYCFKHKKEGKEMISMIDFYVQWNNSSFSNRKRYCAIGQVCPECNDVFFFDRNNFGGKLT